MKKILLICAVIIGFASFAKAQDDTKPEFKFNEEKHDFGKIPQGTPVTTVFEFTNIGKSPLILADVRPTCGCTIADYTKVPVKPGDKGFRVANDGRFHLFIRLALLPAKQVIE